ncbi:hypothetical protein CYY_009665 [Polysphondylium violaceum]|uniref:Fe2OG dioxygenase domain-containing protein n=1 Tax=Polysphondylium violaceum TaxID=133409 RepID=A0A8J4V0B8_9MYCE|nr:hypothetical protein CYY_009665 [Polysphondylium violaceum]
MSISNTINSLAATTLSNEVHLVSLGYGELRLATQYCERKTLEDLFQTEDGLIIVDSEGEEIFVDPKTNLYPLEPENTYTVISEKDLESDTEDNDLDEEEEEEEDVDDEEDEDDREDEHETTTTTTTHSHGHQEGSQLKEETCAHTHSSCCQHNDNHSSCAHDEESEQNHPCCPHDHDNEEVVLNEPQHNHTLNNQVYFKLLRMREARVEMISRLYKRLHPEIFTLSEEFFENDFIEPIRQYRKTKQEKDLLKALNKLTDTDIYQFKIFKLDFCKKLLEEIENFKNTGLPIARPNSMNNYGVVLDEIGFTQFFTDLRQNYLCLFTSILYKQYYGDCIDGHHAFVVQYKMDKDKELAFHYDESDVTVNLCLGSEFTGGSLYFKGILDQPETHSEYFEFQHQVGSALIHIGTHRHGARGLESGSRTNLILWLRRIGY